MDCPCGGKRSSQWHYRHGVDVCEAARVQRNQVEKRWRDSTRAAGKPTRKRPSGPSKPKVRWTPGSDIVIPEFDPL